MLYIFLLLTITSKRMYLAKITPFLLMSHRAQSRCFAICLLIMYLSQSECFAICLLNMYLSQSGCFVICVQNTYSAQVALGMEAASFCGLHLFHLLQNTLPQKIQCTARPTGNAIINTFVKLRSILILNLCLLAFSDLNLYFCIDL
jgi:hypothetical protein